MMRKKAVQNLDSRQKTMIDNAFYYTNPPDRPKVTKKERPPMQEYVRKLIYKDLSKTTTEKVLRQLRKLPWDEEEICSYVVRCLIRSWNVKYSNIHCAANLLAGLTPYHEHVGIEVVDGVLEEIRVGMEINIPKMNQCRISCVKYLGELYNYQLIESNVIFTVLYSFITFGNSDDGSPSTLDPPEHLFRIRLVCILLDTCGQYFDRGSLKRKLDCFLVYFQAYIWKKKSNGVWNEDCPFPKEVEYMVADTLESLRPKLKLHNSLEEATKAVEELNLEYQQKIDEAVKVVATENKPASAPVQLPLNTNNYGPQSYPQSPADRDEEESETGESDMEVEERNPGGEGNKRKRGGDSLTLDEEEVSEIDSEQEGEDQVKGIGGPKLVPCDEDTDFLNEFQKLIVDDYQSRRTENVKVPSFDVAVPMQLGKKKPGNEEGNRVNFMVMLKKGNRQQLRDLKVPISSDLAANIREKQQEEQAEQEEVKRLVLDYNQRQEEETYNELMAKPRQSSPGNRYHGRRENKPKPTRYREAEQGFFMNK
ncbi:regulator of nonsense transcripts 2-like isoform X1 [Paramuricea clavata]|uniref:Regulator of nonsense transcripts 2-like isoform X1 n=2 Tax=Paramuricea clavata TaxID=317549 RepID=A0A6S7JH44_PARCT|nr:regulator of nonsense transcripts 2-like isoform X1 [Paramuricea clavata]